MAPDIPIAGNKSIIDKSNDEFPSSPSSNTHPLTSTPVALLAFARPIFIAWELLRILYNLILGLFTIYLVWQSNIRDLAVVVLIAKGAIAANICFFAGPVIEVYIRWLGYRRQWVRWFLFCSGSLRTALLALLTVSSQFF